MSDSFVLHAAVYTIYCKVYHDLHVMNGSSKMTNKLFTQHVFYIYVFVSLTSMNMKK